MANIEAGNQKQLIITYAYILLGIIYILPGTCNEINFKMKTFSPLEQSIFNFILNRSQNYNRKVKDTDRISPNRFEGFSIIPYQRFGNNVFQMLRIIKLCEIYNYHRIVIPYGFLFFKRNFWARHIKIEIRDHQTNMSRLLSGSFYFTLPLPKFAMNHSYIYYFKDEFLKSIPNISLNKKDLYIHLRSGDIFKESHVHQNYSPPPLNYYLDTMKYRKWRKIHLICEDNNSPYFPILIKEGVSYRNQSFFQDIALILNCYNFVGSKSTLSVALSFLNRNNLSYYFTFNLPTSKILSHYNCDPDDMFVKNFINRWKNNDYQRQLLLQLSCRNWTYFPYDPEEPLRKELFHGDGECKYWFL